VKLCTKTEKRSNPIPANYFKRQIAEVIMFGRQLGDPEVAAGERYLRAKGCTP